MLNWTQNRQEELYKDLYQKNEGGVKPAMMDGRTIYRPLLKEKYLFKVRLTDNPISERCQEKE
jgi:hypothetical protein